MSAGDDDPIYLGKQNSGGFDLCKADWKWLCEFADRFIAIHTNAQLRVKRQQNKAPSKRRNGNDDQPDTPDE